MKKEIEAFVNAANEQELEAAWNNLSAGRNCNRILTQRLRSPRSQPDRAAGGALGNLNLIGRVRSRKLALSAPAPGYKELEVQVKEVPIWQKSNLTLEEAAAYSGIGINKLRSMTDSDECKFVLWNGTKRLIKRRKLDEYLDKAFSI